MSDSVVSVDLPHQPSQNGRWFLTDEQIQQLPSFVDEITEADELRCRQKGGSFIQDMVERLNRNLKDKRHRISQLCVCTSMIYMQRFFTVHSLRVFDIRDVAAACLFLAGKSEESPRRLEHIVLVWWRLKFGSENTMSKEKNPQKYNDAAQLIAALESCVLQTLGFDLTVDVPHGYVLSQMSASKVGKRVTEIAYWFATDIIHITNWGIRYPAPTLAAICIHLACTWAEYDFHTTNSDNPWFSNLAPSLTEQELLRMVAEFTELYQKCTELLTVMKYALKNGLGPLFNRKIKLTWSYPIMDQVPVTNDQSRLQVLTSLKVY